MTEPSGADCEMAIVLPLGVVTSQLQRVEAQLRVLDMKAIDYARTHAQGRVPAAVDAKLEQIHEALEAIRSLVACIEADLVPRSPAHLARVTAVRPAAGEATIPTLDARADRVAAKPRPVLDD